MRTFTFQIFLLICLSRGPNNSVPDNLVPDNLVPDNLVPDNSVPDNSVLGQIGPGQFGPEITITQKIKIRKIGNLILLSIQPIPDLTCKFDTFEKKNDFDVPTLV